MQIVLRAIAAIALTAVPAAAQPADTTPPQIPVPAEPSLRTNEVRPTFRWTPVFDVVPTPLVGASGVVEYRVVVRRGATVVLDEPTLTTEGYRPAGPLADGETYTWTVAAVDAAGNRGTSIARTFTVDVASPDPPEVVAGYSPFSEDVYLTLSGAPNAAYAWDVRDAAGTPVGAPGYSGSGVFNGGGRTDEVRRAPLPDGRYTVHVRQTLPGGAASGERVIRMTIDTTAPGAPVVTGTPGRSTDAYPQFTWVPAELGGSFAWEVLSASDPGGIPIWSDTTDRTTHGPWKPLLPWTYVVRVAQIDPAGNRGPWSALAPFEILGPPPPPVYGPPPPVYGPPAGPRAPVTRNAGRLRPRAGARVRRARVVLGWPRARGAVRYRVQVRRTVAGRQRVVHTAVVAGTRHAIPARLLAAGVRYTWRVVPVLRSTGRPASAALGISWFTAVR